MQVNRLDLANSLAFTNLFRSHRWTFDWALCIELVRIYANEKVRPT